uniref:Uncharacterized protein n=1 Tax=Romanomermis culicivorax TaxID=13658 RepID=A0A915JEF7_ROMCU
MAVVVWNWNCAQDQAWNCQNTSKKNASVHSNTSPLMFNNLI